jgi:hypothetical protein
MKTSKNIPQPTIKSWHARRRIACHSKKDIYSMESEKSTLQHISKTNTLIPQPTI